mgnify:CR=1 FL=1|jgi:hypothetical protein
MNNFELTVLGVSSYSFTDEKSGRLVQGTNVWFVEKTKTCNDNTEGFIPKKATIPYELFPKMQKMDFPFLCKPIMEQSFGSKGVITKVVDFEPIKKVEKIGA